MASCYTPRTKKHSRKKIKFSVNKRVKLIKDTPKLSYSPQNVSASFLTSNISRWYEIFNCRYFRHCDRSETVKWSDVADTTGQVLLETIIHLTTTRGQSMTITMYHTNGRIQIQGKHRIEWESGEHMKLYSIYRSLTSNSELDVLAECLVATVPTMDLYYGAMFQLLTST